MAGLITAIQVDAGSVCVKRGGGRNVTLDSDEDAFRSPVWLVRIRRLDFL